MPIPKPKEKTKRIKVILGAKFKQNERYMSGTASRAHQHKRSSTPRNAEKQFLERGLAIRAPTPMLSIISEITREY